MLGYFLGNVAIIRDHTDTMLLVIVVLSVVPIGVEFLRRRASRADEPDRR